MVPNRLRASICGLEGGLKRYISGGQMLAHQALHKSDAKRTIETHPVERPGVFLCAE